MGKRAVTAKISRHVGAGGTRYEIIEVPNELAAKAGNFHADHINGAAIAAEIARLGQHYPGMVCPDIERLAQLWAGARGGREGRQAEEELFRIAHDLAGQSTTFGYALVAAIAGGLRMLIEGDAVRREHVHPAVAAHIAALEQTLRHGVKGDGGQSGRHILASLHAAVIDCLPR